MRANLRKPRISARGKLLTFDSGRGLDLRNQLQQCEHGRVMEAEKMAAIGMMACSISHDMRHSLSAIYANAEFLEREDICASTRADLLLEIQEAVVRMAERIDSLLQFGNSGRNPLIPEPIAFVVEKAVAAVKSHPDGRSVSISVGNVPTAEAEIDARNLESAIYNLLLNGCQAATCSTHVPEVKVHVSEVGEQIYITISDNGPGIPSHVQRTLFIPFVTVGKPNGTGLGLTLARRIAEQHGGSLRLVESKPGKTEFTLSLMKNGPLPLDDQTINRAGFEGSSDGSASYSKKTNALEVALMERTEPASREAKAATFQGVIQASSESLGCKRDQDGLEPRTYPD